MPHLAPMSWTLAILMVWLFITMINTMNWWSTPMKFSYYKPSNKSTQSNNWLW